MDIILPFFLQRHPSLFTYDILIVIYFKGCLESVFDLLDHDCSDHDWLPYFVIYFQRLILKVSDRKRNLPFDHKWVHPKESFDFDSAFEFSKKQEYNSLGWIYDHDS